MPGSHTPGRFAQRAGAAGFAEPDQTAAHKIDNASAFTARRSAAEYRSDARLAGAGEAHLAGRTGSPIATRREVVAVGWERGIDAGASPAGCESAEAGACRPALGVGGTVGGALKRALARGNADLAGAVLVPRAAPPVAEVPHSLPTALALRSLPGVRIIRPDQGEKRASGNAAKNQAAGKVVEPSVVHWNKLRGADHGDQRVAWQGFIYIVPAGMSRVNARWRVCRGRGPAHLP
jgi:hypothetical protein